MMRIRTLFPAALLAATVAAPAAAQLPRVSLATTPTTWTTLSVGYMDLPGVYEGGSASTWDIGGFPTFRATIEQEFRRGAQLGAALSYASMPMTYYGADCGGCNADAKLWQALGLFRIGAGTRFHQVIEVSAGVSSVQDVRLEDGGGRIGPTDPVMAPTIGLGYGFAYPLSPRTQFVLMQEFGLMFFKRGDAPAGSDESRPRTQVTRIGLRMGLGGR